MPLSELYRLGKGKLDPSQEKNFTCSTDLTSGAENDFLELVWENGQIQSSRARKILTSNSLPSQSFKIRDKDIGNGSNTKMGRFGVMDSGLDEVPMSVPSAAVLGLNPDYDMVPWLNYSIDDSLQHDYCPEFLTELSGVTGNEHSQNTFTSLDKRNSGNQSIRDSNTVSAHNGSSLEQGHMPRVSSAGDSDFTRPTSSSSQLYPSSSSQQCQTSFPYFRSRLLSSNVETMSNPSNQAASGESVRAPPSGFGFTNTKVHKQVMSTSTSSLMNFSHFARPAALAKANFQNIGARAGSGMSSIERIGSKDKSSVASSSNPAESMPIDTFSCLRKETSSHCHHVVVSSKVDDKPFDPKPADEPLRAKQPEAADQEDDSNNDKNYVQVTESATKGLVDGEKILEPMVTSSSVCSGNSVERVSDEPMQNLKRKNREAEESEGPSEENEEESIGAKKAAPARGGSGSKRSRAAEVHNLSERRRRDRINEKMRALQELIPNCNKVDKASMLDEAIEYLKTLQLQVQIMSMGSGLYMPSMMMPPGMPHLHAAHMAQFSSMGLGMGMGMGMGMGFGMAMPDMISGSSGCSMIQVPPVHGAHFPSPPLPGPSALHGMGGSNLPMFGFTAQGHPMPYPCAPLMPMSGVRPVGLNTGGMAGAADNLDSALGSSSKDPIQNINSQTMQNAGANISLNQTSSQPALVQNGVQASEVTENGTLKSGNETDNAPSGASGSDPCH